MSAPVGSWHVDGHNMAAVIRKTVDGWDLVARCPNENASWREDARLMAAAPAMLAFLKTVGEGDLEYMASAKFWNDLDAIVAKAEGRS